jgi:hypothetical protein
MMAIWKLRAIPEVDEFGTSAELFSRHCLVPTALVYSACVILEKELDASQNTKIQRTLNACVLNIEHLLVRHIIRPAHRSYFSTRNKHQKAREPTLQTLLESLQTSIELCIASENQTLLELLLAAIPKIFALAVQNSDRSTHTRKLNEAPWLDTIFDYLTTFVGSPVAVVKLKLRPALLEMVHTATIERITISRRILRDVLSKYAQLPLSDPANAQLEVRWQMVIDINFLDPEVFTADETVESDANIPRFRTALVNSISNALPNAETEKNLIEVLNGLVSTFSRVKKMASFMSLWFDQIAKIRDEVFRSDDTWSFWISPKAVYTVHLNLWSTAAPVQQGIFQEYATMIHSLATDLATKAEQSHIQGLPCWEKGIPALVIMDAVLEAASGRRVLQDYTNELCVLSCDIAQVMKHSTEFPKFEGMLWCLLSRAQSSLAQFADSRLLHSQATEMVTSFRDRALFLVSNASGEVSEQAFMFFLALFRPISQSGNMAILIRDIIKSLCAKLLSDCEAILSREDDSKKLHRREMFRIWLLVHYSFPFE